MKLAVIGGGLSGSLVIIYALRQTSKPITIYLFEKNQEQLNKGVAYSSHLPYQLLNVAVKDMSLFTDDSSHFLTWLKEKGYHYQPADFVPRDVYGSYIADVFARETKGKDGVEIRIIKEEVTGISKKQGQYDIAYGPNETLPVDKVVLCTGNFPPGDVPGLTAEVKESKNYISHPWSGFDVGSVPGNYDLLMVGSGLTMIDIVLSLEKNKHKGKITVISRRGLLPLPHGDAPEYKLNKGPELKEATAVSFLNWVKQNIKEAEANGKSWRSVIDAVREHIPHMWGALPAEEKKRFIRHVRPFWEIHRHRMPQESIAILEKMQAENRLEIVAGRIQAAEVAGNKVKVTYRCRNSATLKHITSDTIINCTGPETEYRKLRSALYQSLIQNKLAQPEPLSLGLDITTEGFIIDALGKVDSNMAVIGPPAKGVLWECTALREIRQQALSISKALLKSPTGN